MSEFFGIVIALFYADHAPPHFHARYGEHEVLVAIDSLDVIRGGLPRRALALVLEWAYCTATNSAPTGIAPGRACRSRPSRLSTKIGMWCGYAAFARWRG